MLAATGIALAPPVGAEPAAGPTRAKAPARAQKASALSAAKPARSQRAKFAVRRAAAVVAAAPERLSFGQRAGLHGALDPLDLKSSVALVMDPETNQVLFSKNPSAVLPIASITKLMTALVVVEAGQPLEERLTISDGDIDLEKGSRSRLKVGSELSRGEMLHLALMASENRAANALGRHYPGGLPAFVAAMNDKARDLGMLDTRYVEPTGLSSNNQSSANDLSMLVKAASNHRLIRELSTSQDAEVSVGPRHVQFRNTNGLMRDPTWEIALQKTGYISEAGRCVVMQTQLAGRKLIMVLLDSAGRYSRIADAERIRMWLSATLPAVAVAAPR